MRRLELHELYWFHALRASRFFCFALLLMLLFNSGSGRLHPVEQRELNELKSEALRRLHRQMESRYLQPQSHPRRNNGLFAALKRLRKSVPQELPQRTLGTIDLRCDGFDASTERMKAASQTDECCCRVQVDCRRSSSGCAAATRACTALQDEAGCAAANRACTALQGASGCAAAARACTELQGASINCTGYELNQERTWATLKGTPRWWHSSPGVSTCKRLVRVQSRHDTRGKQRKAWAAAWCNDYTRGERMQVHRSGRLIFDVGFHDGSDSIHVRLSLSRPEIHASAEFEPRQPLSLECAAADSANTCFS